MPDPSTAAAPVRSFWSGTITFGLVSIPVEFYAAARARQTSMKLVDAEGHPLGRQYTREDDDKPLANTDIVRGFETEEGKMVVIADEEFEAAAPETSHDIDLHRFVPLEQIAPWYFVRPYFLAPAARSGKAYTLLAKTMEATGKVGIGRFVMRGHEYLVAIIAEGGILRAETLRYADELRTAEAIGLPRPATPPAKLVKEFAKEIEHLQENRLDLHELEDRQAEALQALAERKRKQHKDVISLSPQAEDEQEQEGGAQIVDLVQLLRRSLGGKGAAAGERGAKAEPHEPMSEDLSGKSREELYKMASDLGISGRSKMSKEQLIEAVQGVKQAA